MTFLFYHFAVSQTHKDNDASFFISLAIIVLWLVTFLAALDQARRKNLFSAKLCLWAILIIQFCTPFPMLGLYSALNPQSEANALNADNRKTNGDIKTSEKYVPGLIKYATVRLHKPDNDGRGFKGEIQYPKDIARNR